MSACGERGWVCLCEYVCSSSVYVPVCVCVCERGSTVYVCVSGGVTVCV